MSKRILICCCLVGLLIAAPAMAQVSVQVKKDNADPAVKPNVRVQVGQPNIQVFQLKPGVQVQVQKQPGIHVQAPRVHVQAVPGQPGVATLTAPVSPYWIGLLCGPVNELTAAQLSLPANQGLVVENVVPESPAEKAEIKRFDILLVAGDARLKTIADLVGVVKRSEGKSIKITLMRGGKKLTVDVTPEKRPEIHRAPAIGGGPIGKIDPNSPDWKRVQAWMKRMGQPMGAPAPIQGQAQRMHPGIIVPPRMPAMPLTPAQPGAQPQMQSSMQMSVDQDGVQITIQRTNDKPADITVKKDDKTWQVTEETIDTLPEDIQKKVKPLLKKADPARVNVRVAPMGAMIPGMNFQWQGQRPGIQVAPKQGDDDGQVEQMQQQIQQMQQQLQKLQQQRQSSLEQLQKEHQERIESLKKQAEETDDEET